MYFFSLNIEVYYLFGYEFKIKLKQKLLHGFLSII